MKNPIDLAKYAQDLAVKRDEHLALFDEFGDRADRGRAKGYRDALAMLHDATGGEFGQSLFDQLGGAS